MSPGSDETEDVVRPPGRPGVGRELALRVTEDFNMTEQIDRQIGERDRTIPLEPTARRMAPVSPLEKRDARARQAAAARPLQALRTVADARSIPPQPIFIIIARSQVQRAPQPLQHLYVASRRKIALSQRYTGLSLIIIKPILTKVSGRRIESARPPPPRLAQSECAPVSAAV